MPALDPRLEKELQSTASLSLIVATVGRAAPLARLFSSLKDSKTKDFDVILVDQSPSAMASVIEALTIQFSSTIDIHYVRDTGKGLSRARNLGLGYARGEFIGFPDDDCWYRPDTVGKVLNYFTLHPDIGILSGQYTEPGKTNRNFSQVAGVLSLWNLHNCSSSVGTFLNRKKLLGVSTLFDERIGAGTPLPAGEETDLLFRLLIGGVQGFYEPDLVVHHQIHRDKTQSRSEFFQLRKAYWFVIGKNYQRFFTEARLALGALSCLLKPQLYGRAVTLKAMWEGLRQGRAASRGHAHS